MYVVGRFERGIHMAEKKAILKVNNLKVYFPINESILSRRAKHVKAIDDIDLYIANGETLGLVGESGCGKSTTGRAILGLLKEAEGEVIFDGNNVLKMKNKQLKGLRKEMQLVFQDPFASLNPRMKIGDVLEEVLVVHKMKNKEKRKSRVKDLIQLVGLNEQHLNRYPHEFSGGQRQRIVIARALAMNPKFIVCDEIVSALDVSIQSQIINLLEDLQKKLNLTYLFIGHDLSIIRHISDRIAVMYLGKIVEIADKNDLFERPKHPYTKALLSAVLVPDPEQNNEDVIIEGETPNPINPPQGCRFHTRCKFATEKCKVDIPSKRKVAHNHFVHCHYDLNL